MGKKDRLCPNPVMAHKKKMKQKEIKRNKRHKVERQEAQELLRDPDALAAEMRARRRGRDALARGAREAQGAPSSSEGVGQEHRGGLETAAGGARVQRRGCGTARRAARRCRPARRSSAAAAASARCTAVACPHWPGSAVAACVESSVAGETFVNFDFRTGRRRRFDSTQATAPGRAPAHAFVGKGRGPPPPPPRAPFPRGAARSPPPPPAPGARACPEADSAHRCHRVRRRACDAPPLCDGKSSKFRRPTPIDATSSPSPM